MNKENKIKPLKDKIIEKLVLLYEASLGFRKSDFARE